jgi:hypothetical protein
MPALRHAELLEERVRFVGAEVDELALDLRADHHRLAGQVRLDSSRGPWRRRGCVRVGEVGVLHVAREDRRLVGEQEELPRDRLLLRRHRHRQHRLAGVERRLDLGQHGVLRRRGLLALLDVLGDALALLLHRLEVGEHQLGVDHLDVAHRIDRAGDVVDVLVVEAADHLDDGVDLADVGQELVAEALALARALDQAGDVDELDRGRMTTLVFAIFCRTARRASGTVTMPTFGVDRAEG